MMDTAAIPCEFFDSAAHPSLDSAIDAPRRWLERTVVPPRIIRKIEWNLSEWMTTFEDSAALYVCIGDDRQISASIIDADSKRVESRGLAALSRLEVKGETIEGLSVEKVDQRIGKEFRGAGSSDGLL